mgnify:CR=1 FL=1
MTSYSLLLPHQSTLVRRKNLPSRPAIFIFIYLLYFYYFFFLSWKCIEVTTIVWHMGKLFTCSVEYPGFKLKPRIFLEQKLDCLQIVYMWHKGGTLNLIVSAEASKRPYPCDEGVSCCGSLFKLIKIGRHLNKHSR